MGGGGGAVGGRRMPAGRRQMRNMQRNTRSMAGKVGGAKMQGKQLGGRPSVRSGMGKASQQQSKRISGKAQRKRQMSGRMRKGDMARGAEAAVGGRDWEEDGAMGMAAMGGGGNKKEEMLQEQEHHEEHHDGRPPNILKELEKFDNWEDKLAYLQEKQLKKQYNFLLQHDLPGLDGGKMNFKKVKRYAIWGPKIQPNRPVFVSNSGAEEDSLLHSSDKSCTFSL